MNDRRQFGQPEQASLPSQDALLEGLNEAQQQAISLPAEGHALIIAGAGSGKTRVLTHRVAWLMQLCRADNLLAVTFTNKAANEMRQRINRIVETDLTRSFWCGTFHGLNHRWLRYHHQAAELSAQFQVMDADDQLSLIKRTLKDLNLDTKQYSARQSQNYINSCKDQGLRAQDLEIESPWQETQLAIYQHYEMLCKRGDLVDFAEILLRSFETLANHPALLEQYQQRWSHLLIDEFQDTNTIQYEWVKLLNGKEGNTFIVGDDDQSIYGWRGAKVENIRQFKQDFSRFKPVAEIRLEQNYRSNRHILGCANQVIAKNPHRLGKNLWTQQTQGSVVQVHRTINGKAEANLVVNHIEHWLEQGKLGSEVAILYRSNAQSRLFEEALLRNHIAYRIYGGVRFFERAEIKDILAYLRLLISPNDNVAFLRIINHPPRAIGAKTIENLVAQGNANQISYLEAAQSFNHRAVEAFLRDYHQWHQQIVGKSVQQQLDYLYRNLPLKQHYAKESREKAEIRCQNIEELIVAASEYESAEQLIAQAALEAGEQAQIRGFNSNFQPNEQDFVQLMTIHAAKGLEFPMVFLVGLEEGLFPSKRSLEEPAQMAEERRLAYVAMTRARHHLHLSFAGYRQLYGNRFDSFPPSQFLRDLPEEHMELHEFI